MGFGGVRWGSVGLVGLVVGLVALAGAVLRRRFLAYRYHSMTDGMVLRLIDLHNSLFDTDSTSANANVDPS